MSLFTDHPRSRWAAPGAALAVIGATALAVSFQASADPSLPARSAEQLLVDVQRARLAGLSGTVVQTSNLGLPELPGMNANSGGSSSLTSMVAGTHTWRVWTAGPQQSRVALVGSLGESDVIRNGRDLWVWSSREKTAVHVTLPEAAQHKAATPNPADLPKTPQEAADQALEALSPTTSVTTAGSATVAGRPAYEFVLRPKQDGSRVAQVRISVDAAEHVPLRVQVYSTKLATPAFEVGFTSVEFGKPDAGQFAFNPPPGTTVTESRFPDPAKARAKDGAKAGATDRENRPEEPAVVGTGWSTVLVTRLDSSPTVPQNPSRRNGTQVTDVLSALPRVTGSWGSGRVLDGTLVSVVVTDDGRVAVGAVAPDRLYAALAAR